MNFTELTWLWIVLIGMIGGFLNALLEGSLKLPKIIELPEGKGQALDLGWVGNVLIGGAGSVVFWGFGLGNPEPPQVYITALLSGMAGAKILTDYMDKRVLNVVTDSLAEELGETIT